MGNPGVVETLVRLLGQALTPLAQALKPDTAVHALEDVGLRLPPGSLQSGAVTQALQSASAACSQLPAALKALADAAEGDDGPMLLAAAQVAQRIAAAGNAFGSLGTALQGVIQASGALNATQKQRLGAIAQQLPARLAHRSLIRYLDSTTPGLKAILDVAGIIDDTENVVDPADVTSVPYRLARIRFDQFALLVQNPVEYLKVRYDFGTADFDGLALFSRVAAAVGAPDVEPYVITEPGKPNALEALAFRLSVQPGAVPGLRIRLRTSADKDVGGVAGRLGGPWSSLLSSKSRFASGMELVLHPTDGLRIEPPQAASTFAFSLSVIAQHADDTPMILIGQSAGSRLELRKFELRVPVELSAAAGAASPSTNLAIEVAAPRSDKGPGGRLVIDTSTADGFVKTILGGVRVQSDFDLSANYDLAKGLRFSGSSTIEVAIPAHVSLGPISIPTLYLVGGFDAGTPRIEFSADIGAKLGPLNVSVNRLGAAARLSFPDKGGNAGPLQIDLDFSAPTGAGVAIDAGFVSGGGFLAVDKARGEYSGAIELTLAGFLSLKALGIITTKKSDGTESFAFLVIITAEFGSGLQLGFGFTLLAVGGLLGLNRSMNLTALADGIRSGAIESVMFPHDVIANAPRIISDLRVFFPLRDGAFLIGPMAKLGWGTPTLVSLSIGVIVEIPGNVAIVGVLKVNLPSENLAVVRLQANFIGALEFDRKRGWFFASLFDSRVLFITIDGEMGVLVDYGNDANFVLAVGGFHPRYAPPPLPFPEPRRVSVDIINTKLARIRAQGYFATTSNAVMFGAEAEAYFGFSALSVTGNITFDALVTLSPFYFVVDFSSQFSVKVFGLGVWGLRIRLEIEGPTPWRARGSAGISLLFVDIDVDVDVSWGEKKDTSLPPIKVLPALGAEFDKPESWRALPPAQSNLLVSLRKLPAGSAEMVLHPLGTLQITQRFAPLDATLARVGAQKPQDGNRFTVAAASPVFEKRRDLDGLFAPAQFEDLTEADRLSRKGFEPRHAGLELSATGSQMESATAIVRVARYDLITVDTNGRRRPFRFFRLAAGMFAHLIRGSAISLSVLSNRRVLARVPVANGVTVRPEGFAVTRLDTNLPFTAASASFISEGAAKDWLARTTSANPSLVGSLQVVPGFEVAR